MCNAIFCILCSFIKEIQNVAAIFYPINSRSRGYKLQNMAATFCIPSVGTGSVIGEKIK